MKVLAIFTCHNRKEKTLACIESLKPNSAQIDFLAVDDRSTDGTVEALNSINSINNIEVINGDGDLYYSGGMRIGIDYAKTKDLTQYKYIIFINDDVVFFEKAIDRLIEMEANRKLIVAGATCDDTGKLSYGGSVRTSLFKPSYKNVMSTSDEEVFCDTFCANCVLIPTEIFNDLPTIDPVYHHAMGDYDYGCEAVRRGYKILAASYFVGICNDNPVVGTWRDNKLSRKNRVRKKESPKGLPIKEYYHYLLKNHGFCTAVIYSLVPYIRILLGL